MNTIQDGTVAVPGAQLYYTMHGSGPLLLILQGGDGNADGAISLAGHLADHYTVVTYDRRGLSRSRLADPAAAITLQTHGDDVHHLLAALTTEPVYVLGVSIGALIGLDLVARYSAQIHTLVAHEPPATALLPDTVRKQAAQGQREVEEIYHRDGVQAAMRKFLAMTGVNLADHEPDVVWPRPNPQRQANLTFFLTHDAPAVRWYNLDVAALKAAPTRIVPAAGSTSPAVWTHQCAEVLAEQLGTPLVEFPGGHNGHVSHPRAFAAKLREVLGH
jgi:pimeloyl-ACP methyl ester carboxylesterase